MDLDQPDEAWIDLVLQNDGQTRRLRFYRPKDIKIEEEAFRSALAYSSVTYRNASWMESESMSATSRTPQTVLSSGRRT